MEFPVKIAVGPCVYIFGAKEVFVVPKGLPVIITWDGKHAIDKWGRVRRFRVNECYPYWCIYTRDALVRYIPTLSLHIVEFSYGVSDEWISVPLDEIVVVRW